MRKPALVAFALYGGALLIGFLLGTAAHQPRHKSPAVIQFEPASRKPPTGKRSIFTYPDRVV